MKRALQSLTAITLASSFAHAEKAYDAVEKGRIVFESLGCVVCHATDKNDPSAKTGPNLYGLFLNQARDIQVLVAESQQKHTRKANKDYLTDTIRNSMDELAIAREGPTQGIAFQPVMPSFPKAVISDSDLDSVFHYLRTRADKGQAGPAKVMVTKNQTANVASLIQIPDEVLVSNRTRVVRAALDGLSVRSLHVGQPNGVHYTFDQRFLSLRRIWSGGFLNLKEERRGRAGRPSDLGHVAKIIIDDDPLLAPLTATGNIVDFEFKEPDFADIPAIEKYVWESIDFSERLAKLDAEFIGHEIAADGSPNFRFRIGKNQLKQSINLTESGLLEITMTGTLREKQQFQLRREGLNNVQITGATLDKNLLTISPSAKPQTVKLSAQIAGNFSKPIATGGAESWKPQTLSITPSKPGKKPLEVPAGYSVMSWNSPRDLYGRKQLFEPTGIAVAKNGTIVISTRTAGIWRIRDGYWSLFAEGTFESLGVCIEDDQGDQIVISQKPELTRITDTDGDGRADQFTTVCDDFGIHGNYHEYTHGPVRDADGNYYFNLNLAHAPKDLRASWRGGSACMGSMGGYRGWSCKVAPDGSMTPFASGLRSPAGIGIDPNGRLWYAENQGDYVGSSKIVPLEEGKFYGHPAGLEALPGMTPESPQLKPELWADKLRKGAVWFPQRRLANSPGNPVWDTTNGKFSRFGGQMFVGEQTLSKLIRVVTEQVKGVDQGCAIPFASGFASGIMRPVFLPDGSLLLGQTGRGWGSVGGHQEALQQVIWDGKTETADINRVAGHPKGMAIHFTHPLKPSIKESDLLKSIKVSSWFYTNTGKYGSPEHDLREDALGSVTISDDRTQAVIQPTGFANSDAWLDRVYHLQLASKSDWFKVTPAKKSLEAYFTLRAIAD